MTRDVVENILVIEKKADGVISRAHADAQALIAEATRTIEELRATFKSDSKKAYDEQKAEVSEKVKKSGEKIERALQEELAVLADGVKKSRAKAKKELLTSLLK